MDDYIAKPIMPQALIAVIEKWTNAKAADTAQAPVRAASPIETAAEKKPVFDRAEFLERMMGDNTFARRIADNFRRETPAVLDALQGCIERGETTQAADHAHGLKGSAANVNGQAMSELAHKVQEAGDAGDLAGMASCFPQLRAEFAILAAALLRI